MGVKERRAREKEKRRQEILDTAKKVFMMKGISLTTIEDIANGAELSPATIYLYFRNKEELYASLNLATLEFIYHEVRKIFHSKKLGGPREKIAEVKNAFYKAYKSDPLILRNIMRGLLENTLTTLSSDLVSGINSLTKTTMTIIKDIYEEGVREGIFREEKGIAVADMMWAMFVGLVLYEEAKKGLDHRKNFLKSTLDMAFDIFLKGVLKREG